MTRVGFVWDNFGPLHVDRVAAAGRSGIEAVGIELFATSDTYGWQAPQHDAFRQITLFPDGGWKATPALRLARAIVGAVRRERLDAAFLCHYQEPGVFLAAAWLRLTGFPVFAMGCSKFDDYPRRPAFELFKSWLYKPYRGAIGSRRRSTEYLRFLGVPADMIEGGYNTVSHDRIRAMAQSDAPLPAWEDRPFVCVARLVPKKNLAMLLDAYAIYAAGADRPRRLVLCGDGPLLADLSAQAERLGIAGSVEFTGFVQTDEVARRLRDALCLILPSHEEQFGNVVPEAQALDLPVLISTACGAADELVRSAVNGHLVEPDNPRGLAHFMHRLGSDRAHWDALRAGVADLRAPGDVAAFAAAVHRLTDRAGVRTA